MSRKTPNKRYPENHECRFFSDRGHIGETIEKKIRILIAQEKKKYKIPIIISVFAFTTFVTVISFLGVFSKERIYNYVLWNILNDEQLKLDDYPKLQNKFNRATWDCLLSGDQKTYDNLFNNENFFESFVASMSKRLYDPHYKNKESIILRLGKIPVFAEIVVVGPEFDGQTTELCGYEFDAESLQAILVVPKENEKHRLPWLDCRRGFPEIFLKISSNGAEVSDVKLVGLSIKDDSDRVVLRISRHVAEMLNLSDWKNYKARTTGQFSVSSVE